MLIHVALAIRRCCVLESIAMAIWQKSLFFIQFCERYLTKNIVIVKFGYNKRFLLDIIVMVNVRK